MDPTLVSALVGFGTGIAANMTTAALSAVYQRAFAQRPDLEQRLSHPASQIDANAALGELAGVIEALAGSGTITVDGALVRALRSATFDHQHGTVRIANAVVSAPVLTTGGTGTGSTHIEGNTTLASAGTSIQVGAGCGIVMTGGASIKQN